MKPATETLHQSFHVDRDNGDTIVTAVVRNNKQSKLNRYSVERYLLVDDEKQVGNQALGKHHESVNRAFESYLTHRETLDTHECMRPDGSFSSSPFYTKMLNRIQSERVSVQACRTVWDEAEEFGWMESA